MTERISPHEVVPCGGHRIEKGQSRHGYVASKTMRIKSAIELAAIFSKILPR